MTKGSQETKSSAKRNRCGARMLLYATTENNSRPSTVVLIAARQWVRSVVHVVSGWRFARLLSHVQKKMLRLLEFRTFCSMTSLRRAIRQPSAVRRSRSSR